MEFGKLQSMSLRDIWAGEASDFTPWLAQNLDALADQLGMELALENTEVGAGDFSADIVARDLATNRRVVIENQYGSTDHKHMGQIITYSSVLDASAVIWVAETIRDEHKTAIDFLNRHLKEELKFYAVEVSVIRIDDSRPAYTFNVVCMPPETLVTVPTADTSDIRQKYRAYYQTLIDELRSQYQFTKARVGLPQNWYSFTSENSRVFLYSTSFAMRGRVRTEVYIDCGDQEQNKALFDRLMADQAAIEAEFGSPLCWERLDNRRACRIAVYREGEIDAPTEELEVIRQWTIQQLLKFKAVFPRRILAAYQDIQAATIG